MRSPHQRRAIETHSRTAAFPNAGMRGARAVTVDGGAHGKRGSPHVQIPPRGSGQRSWRHGRTSGPALDSAGPLARSTPAGVGSLRAETRATGPMTRLGVLGQIPGPRKAQRREGRHKALASKRDRRRCRTGTDLRAMGKREFLLFARRNRAAQKCRAETVPRRKPGTYAPGSGPCEEALTDVTDRATTATNRARTAAAGVIPGACVVSR